MGLHAHASVILAESIQAVAEELTDQLRDEGSGAGLTPAEVNSLEVRYTAEGGWVADGNEGVLEKEYGSPPLGLLRRFDVERRASGLLNTELGRRVS